MAEESPGSGRLDQRLVELFKEASSLSGEAREQFVRKVREGDSALAASLVELLGPEGPVPSEPGSLAQRIREQYGSEADPHITLEAPSTPESDFASEIVKRLAGREGAYGRYQLKGEVARGGQGAILRVWDEDLRRNLAMKVVLGKGQESGNTPKVDSKTLGRFLEEAQVTGQLDHPGIVPVHELGLDSEGQVYFTMKLVKGRDLEAIFDLVHEGKEGWSQTRALNVMLKVCEAMAYAHSKGVIHRDLKPGNVMVGKYGEVYVMDWGLARVLGKDDKKDLRIRPLATSEVHSDRKEAASDDSPLITMDGDVVGTPAYMSPEQAAGDLGAMGPPSDVYALGAMLYHLLAGHMPYVKPGVTVNNYAIWYQVQQGPPQALHVEAPEAPAELVAICERAMARDASKRYANTEALAVDLRAFLEHRVVRAYEAGAVAELRKWIERNKPLAGALAAGILVLVVGLAASWILKGRADESAALAAEREQYAKEQEEIATQNADLASEREQDALRERANVLRLSAFQRLEDLRKDADELWPPWPEHLEAYEAWLTRAQELVAGLESHRAQLGALDARALPYTEEDREIDRRSHPRFDELVLLRARLAALERAQAVREGKSEVEEFALDEESLPEDATSLTDLASLLVDPYRASFGQEARGLALARLAMERVENDEEFVRAGQTLAWALFANGLDEEALGESAVTLGLAPESLRGAADRANTRLVGAVEGAREGAEEEEIAALGDEVASLSGEVEERRTWRFEREEDRWWHTQLMKLVEEIEAFADAETGLLNGTSAVHGWGIVRRQAFAGDVEGRTVSGAEAAAKWTAGGDRVAANPKYAGFELVAQQGLVPLGPDADSGLEEFGHVLSGEPAVRGADGKLALTEETGLVFVLLPGGTFSMGAQSRDATGANYDPSASGDEGPVHEVTLSAFFLSKYEMTQAQWLRFTGGNPSRDNPETYDRSWNAAGLAGDLLHPVEQVDWFDCVETLERMGLVLPSEAQWEYGARAGTTSVWWIGDEEESLAGAANLSDRYARDNGGQAWANHEEWLNDGNTSHARVGSYTPNPFGLHDVHGNVWEWCRDGYDGSFYGRSPRQNPWREPSGSRYRVYRGSSLRDTAFSARSADRDSDTPEGADGDLGLRPARASLAP